MESPGVPHPSTYVLKKYKESSLEFLHHPPPPLVMECKHQIFIQVLLSET